MAGQIAHRIGTSAAVLAHVDDDCVALREKADREVIGAFSRGPRPHEPVALEIADIAGQDLELNDPMVAALGSSDLRLRRRGVVGTRIGRSRGELLRGGRIEHHPEMLVWSYLMKV